MDCRNKSGNDGEESSKRRVYSARASVLPLVMPRLDRGIQQTPPVAIR